MSPDVTQDQSSNQVRYKVGGMDCASCAAKIDTAVRRMPGVRDVAVSVSAATMTVDHDGSTDFGAVEKKIAGLGYTLRALGRKATVPQAYTHNHHHEHGPGCVHDHHQHDHSGSHGGRHDHAHHHDGSHDHAGHSHADRDAEEIEGLHGHDHGAMEGPWWKSQKGRLTIAAGLAFALAYGLGHLLPAYESYLFIVAILIGLVPIARRAIMAALAGTPFSIEMLMTIAAVGAVVINAAEEAAAVVFLFLVGELLEGVAAGRARASIQGLTALVPKTALLEEGGKTREVPAEELTVDTIILVRPGDRISADGLILSGDSAIDEAPVTGESTPVRKGEGGKVFAGTINGDAALRVKVTAAAQDNTIARVVRLVEEAQEKKAPTERFIDRFSRYYTPGVVAVAALVAILPPLIAGADWSEWIYKGLAILLIGCPCALVISTPAAIAASLSAGARRGLLLKGGAVLEMLGKLTAVALDKTGTLTSGKPQVTDVIAFGRNAEDVLRLSAALETGSSHPLALAVLAKADEEEVDIPVATDTRAIGGKGVAAVVEGAELFLGSPKAAAERVALPMAHARRLAGLNDEGKTVSVLVVDGLLAGAIAMRDEPRADAKAGLQALADAGVKTVMLTGDNARTAAAIGADLGIEVRAELMPEDKQRIVGELQREGFVVGKVGDGINDAPALAAADVGVAMGGGTDVALETADAAVLHGRVSDIAGMIDLSRRTMRNIHQNIAIALGLKAVFLVTTIIGITGLWPAILADTGATVLVTINALRLLRA
ncbi:heavy metal translocating P-type ATPase [Neorhizobium sp. NCHU2750]|uniref:heavy metal translocating P-type ATPase n=1 Tax=Neorhizobium sp. NCHU2750 TaxID=1825976 RepID=UPI000E728878|nr:cation transporter ATP-binding protein [Neorhizobium sp. NCHU2750]